MKQINLDTHKTRYCISCHAEHKHFWNSGQNEFECSKCGLLALDEPSRPDSELMEFFENRGVDFSQDTVVIYSTGNYRIKRDSI